MSQQKARILGAAGVFLTLCAIYLFTAPGRIDIIDGQWRYEVARNWLDTGEPVVADRWLFTTGGQMLNTKTGKRYSVYNAAPSITPMPFMLLSRWLRGQNAERDHFAFSLAGPFFGALLGALLFLAYGLLGVRLRESLVYSAIFCLTTLWWPASVTVFDQNQHAVLLLGSILLAWQSGRRQSLRLAGLAGLLAGLLLNYQEMYGLLLPAVGLAVLAAPQEGSPESGSGLRHAPDRAGLRRLLVFTACCGVGLGLFFAFNAIRFGTPLALGRYGAQTTTPQSAQTPTWGSPLAGFLGLAASPGKGAFWFSPPLILALLGVPYLFRRAPVLALATAAVSAIYLGIIIRLTFFGGDWCWGPRYLIPVMPLWALAFPFAAARSRQPRRILIPLVACGLLVQLLGISLDHHRFFYERDTAPGFWGTQPWFYFHHSQLAARPFEVLASLREGPPAESDRFNCAPTGQVTYCPFGPRDPRRSRLWMRQFQLFYLPRPWWGWISRVVPQKRPVETDGLLLACGVLLAAGGTLLWRAWRSPLAGLHAAPEPPRLARAPAAVWREAAAGGTGDD